jgi:hypothetical protein
MWQNKQLLAEIIGVIILVIFCWWFFWHNPKVIKGLEEDKAELEADKVELGRVIAAKDNQIKLYGDIEKGKVIINAAVQQKISSLRAESRPRRAIIIRAGSVLPPLPTR